MSVNENKGIISAYEKMLKDGSAFKEIDMAMLTEPSVASAEHGLGDKIDTPQGMVNGKEFQDQPMGQPMEEDANYTEFDNNMEQRIASLRNKMKGGKSTNENIGNRELLSLKKRVKRLEEALILVMETHEKILG